MRPSRQVRRSNVRPNYTRNRTRRKRALPQMPSFEIGWLKLVALGIVIILLLVGLGRLTSLHQIVIKGNRGLGTEQVTKLTQDGLDRQLFGHNLLLINTSALSNNLKKADPSIKDAKISRNFFHKITVTITERQPSLNWKTGGVSYLLDVDGTVIGPTEGSYAQLPTITDSSNLPVKEGSRVASTSFVAFARSLAAELPKAGHTISEITVPTTTSELYVRTSKGITLKFDTTRSAGDEIADLQVVQAELTRAKKTPTQYIDLRIEHKAYYK